MSTPLEIRFRGACRTPDPEYGYDLHFPDGETEYFAQQIAKAKAVCASCPILAACRAHGLDGEEFGIWGGLTASEIRAIRAKRLRELEQQTAAAELAGEPVSESTGAVA